MFRFMNDAADCVFCKIVAGKIPAQVVYESRSTLAFLDVAPVAQGHLLLIPKDHYRRLSDMPAEACATLAADLPRLARAVLAVTGSSALNLLQNNGRLAGQVVEHVHFHLIPRRADDGLGFRWEAGKYPPGRDLEMAEAYKAALLEAEQKG